MLKHNIGVTRQVRHVDAIPLFLTIGMKCVDEVSDVREKYSPIYVGWVAISIDKLMMKPMDSCPLKRAALKFEGSSHFSSCH